MDTTSTVAAIDRCLACADLLDEGVLDADDAIALGVERVGADGRPVACIT